MTAPYKLVSREVKHEDTIVDVAGVPVGGPELVVMAGPCAVESEEQILTAARGVAASGASLLRGGAFKPRTSPYDFQGLKQKGLELLTKARAETGLKIVTEVKDTETLGAVVETDCALGSAVATASPAPAAAIASAPAIVWCSYCTPPFGPPPFGPMNTISSWSSVPSRCRSSRATPIVGPPSSSSAAAAAT